VSFGGNPALGSAIVGGDGSSSSSNPIGSFLIPKHGQWVVGTDKSGKAYLFRQGYPGPGGVLGEFSGLQKWYTLPNIMSNDATAGAALHAAFAWLGLTDSQKAVFMQSVDSGAIMQGNYFVAAPKVQAPGTTLPGQGQKLSASEAAPAGITSIPGLSGLLGLTGDWQKLLVRALEALAGMALLLLGLQALTGQGDGNPVTLARKVGRTVR
jgi:hypothetical protein